MKQYLSTEYNFIALTWDLAYNHTMIIKSLDFKRTRAFCLDSGDYLNEKEFEEDKEFIKSVVNQLLNGEYKLYWIE